MENESHEFQRAMAVFLAKGMVHTKPIEIDQSVVDAIGQSLQTVYEPKVYSDRVAGKLLTSTKAPFEIYSVEDLSRLEFLKIAYTKCNNDEQGSALIEAIEKAYYGEENMLKTVEGLLEVMLGQFPGSSTDTPLAVENIKDHARTIAQESSKITIAYTAPRDETSEEQLKGLLMSFADNGIIIGEKNLPVPQSIGMLRPSAYAVADEILQRLPLFNLSMFCPSACVVLTNDLHRIAASVVSLIREAVFMWVVHAVVYLEINPSFDQNSKVAKDQKAYQSYLDQVRSLSGFLQPFCDSFAKEFENLKGEFEDNQEAFFKLIVSFTSNFTFLIWQSVLYLFEFPKETHQALQLSVAFSSRALFTDKELEDIQKHHDGLLALKKKQEDQTDQQNLSDERNVSEVFPELYPPPEQGSTENHQLPKLQDGVQSFVEYMLLINRYSALAWPEISMSQLKDLWEYCKDLCAENDSILPTTLCDVLGLCEEKL